MPEALIIASAKTAHETNTLKYCLELEQRLQQQKAGITELTTPEPPPITS
jgi:hypothetical protein